MSFTSCAFLKIRRTTMKEALVIEQDMSKNHAF